MVSCEAVHTYRKSLERLACALIVFPPTVSRRAALIQSLAEMCKRIVSLDLDYLRMAKTLAGNQCTMTGISMMLRGRVSRVSPFANPARRTWIVSGELTFSFNDSGFARITSKS